MKIFILAIVLLFNDSLATNISSLEQSNFVLSDLLWNLQNNKLNSISGISKAKLKYKNNNQAVGKTRSFSLDLGNNNISFIEAEIKEWPNIRHLYLKKNNLTEFPINVKYITNLEGLFLSHNKLKTSSIPTSIATDLKHLTHIDLGYNKLKKLDESLFTLKQIKMLNLSGNQIEIIPSEIKNLKKLSCLWLGNNLLTELPADFNQLLKLHALDLNNNHFQEVPEVIKDLKDLAILELNSNNIKTFCITNPKIELLDLSNNQIEEVPENLKDLPKLQILLLINNKIKKIPKSVLNRLYKYRFIYTIQLQDNPADFQNEKNLKGDLTWGPALRSSDIFIKYQVPEEIVYKIYSFLCLQEFF